MTDEKEVQYVVTDDENKAEVFVFDEDELGDTKEEPEEKPEAKTRAKRAVKKDGE